MELFKERRYVYALTLVKKEASCAVLYPLKASQLIGRDTRKCRVTVVQSKCNSGMQKDRSRLKYQIRNKNKSNQFNQNSSLVAEIIDFFLHLLVLNQRLFGN